MARKLQALEANAFGEQYRHVRKLTPEGEEKLKRAGYVLAMRLLQSAIALDDEERAAMERFLPAPPKKPNTEHSGTPPTET